MRSPLALGAACLALALLIPAGATLVPASDEPPVLTYFLHGATPVGNVEDVADSNSEVDTPVVSGGVSGLGPTMTTDAPTGASPKTSYTSGLGNPDFRRNFLLAYWNGEASGRIQEASATLWLQAPAPALVTVTLFADGGIGSGAPFAHARLAVPASAPAAYTFDFGDAAANVDTDFVLSVSSELVSADQNGDTSGDPGVAILYDATSAPSSLTFTLGPHADPEPPLVRVPALGWSNVTRINGSAAHRETSLAVSPVDDDLLIACAPSGVPNTEGGQSYFHVSRDGGDSWSFLDVETASTDPRQFAFEGGDCDVAFDAAGTLYSADTWLGSLSVGSSRDGGVSWTGTNLASSAPVVDRPWLVGGPAGTIHVTWQDLQSLMPSAIWYARSTDFGLTFTPAVSVATVSDGGGFTWTGNLVVAPDQQHLYSIYTRRAMPVTTDLDSGPETIWVAASADGGLTWTQHLVASMPHAASYLYPSLGMDAAGGLHAVFTSRTDTDRPVWYSASVDGAQTWSTPTTILDGVASYAPWVVGDGAGGAVVQWLGSPDPAATESTRSDWFFYLARVQDGAVVSAQTTTTTPIYHGTQTMPEFNQVRLDSQGRAHIGASAFEKTDGATHWSLFHQREQ
ncbi:MAG TPA: sialidase family protein [Candidatus Thermoplasmatota archaeon]|nr:sialidase family protein [Candidatus Thermoplasmatota archaeon]